MKLVRSLPAALVCLVPEVAAAQTSYAAPDGRNRFPAVTIFCPSGTGVVPCNFGSGGGGGGGAVSLNQGGAAVSSSNRLPVQDIPLDALISGGALTIGGAVSLAGTPTVNLGTGGAVSINQSGSAVSASNRLPVQDIPLDALISGGALSIGGTVSLAGTPTVNLAAGGAVSVSNLPATQAVSGAVSQAGSWSVGLANGSSVALSAGNASIGQVAVSALPPLSAGSNAIGSVSVSNLPSTQAISAAALPLPAGAATAAGQAASLGPVAPGTAAPNSTLVGCVANTTLPSFTAGQQGAVPCDTSGRPYVVTVPSANNVPTYLQAVASGGATVFRAINTASSVMATSVKASTGMVYAYEACNTGNSGAYLRLFALGTAPTVGTSAPLISKLLSPGTCQETGVAVGMAFSNGIAFDVTSGSMADSDTTAVASANQISVNIYYK